MSGSGHVVRAVRPGSIADELKIEPGDLLLSINDEEIGDLFDYQYQVENDLLNVLIERGDSGEQWLLEIEKDEDEDLGLIFDEGLMDRYRSCRNRCIFCFIDQMPPGMRETLYFKDDDARLSFLQGNYVTLTNMSDHEIDRIIRYRLSPINISFHTTDPELRCKMLQNRYAGDVFDKVRRLAEAGIELNGQIVLCKGINDGDALDRSIRDLTAYLPALQSLSVVPVGLTRFRDGLYPLEAFSPEDAACVLDQIGQWQAHLLQMHQTRLVYASDEFYLLAGREIPPAEAYEDFPQLENGVGMLRLLEDEFCEALAAQTTCRVGMRTIATGCLAAPLIRKLAELTMTQFPQLQIRVVPVQNHFFGSKITVSGLLTGQDLIRGLSERTLGEMVLIPSNMLRHGTEVFLDDLTCADVAAAIGVPVRPVSPDGAALVRAMTEGSTTTDGNNVSGSQVNPYEPDDTDRREVL